MREVVIVEAVRTPFGKRNGGLSTMHSLDLLGVGDFERPAHPITPRARSPAIVAVP